MKRYYKDVPGATGVKYPSSNAGDAHLIPGGGTKSPHATGQLSPYVTTWEACAPQLEKSVHHNEGPAQPKIKVNEIL